MVGSCVPLSFSPLCFVSYPSAENSPFLYQANFASRIDGALPFIRGVRARLLLIQQVISRLERSQHIVSLSGPTAEMLMKKNKEKLLETKEVC
jgi:hypothetical protein